MSPEVQAQHIALYVNEFSLDVGDEGLRAIARLVGAGTSATRSSG
jgi:1,4-dihydroxy-6-naphthoate synthase